MYMPGRNHVVRIVPGVPHAVKDLYDTRRGYAEYRGSRIDRGGAQSMRAPEEEVD
jgi:hypothetical protein